MYVRLTLPWRLVDVETGNRALKVAHVGEAMRAQGTQLWKLEMGAKYLENVCETSVSLGKGITGHACLQPREGPSGNPTCRMTAQ